MKSLLSILLLCAASLAEPNRTSHDLLQQVQNPQAAQKREGVRIEMLKSSKSVLEAVEANRHAGSYFQILVWSSKDPNSKAFKRIFESQANANENRELQFYTFNLDAEAEAAKNLGLLSVPSVLMESPFKAGELRKWSPLITEQYASGQTIEQRARLVTRDEYKSVLSVQRDLLAERQKNRK